jgi:hypothetical protein
MMNQNSQYFATYDFYSQQMLDALIEKINIYRDGCINSGKMSLWERATKNYYGFSTDGQKSSNMVSRYGEQGQYLGSRVNDYRNLVQHQLILMTSQRPAGQAKAINSDPQSLQDAKIGTSIVEYYLSQARWEAKFISAGERALVTDEAYAVLDWDATKGEQIAVNPETGKPITTGDPTLRIVPGWNCARDLYLNETTSPWHIPAWRENKWELAAKFPNQADKIINSDGKSIKQINLDSYSYDKTDYIPVFLFTHDKTSAVPQGRYTLFTTETILLDTEFPHDSYNVYRISQNDIFDTSFGYTNNYDILSLDEMSDAVISLILTNIANYGGNLIIGPKGSGFDHKEIGKGNIYCEVDPQYVDKVHVLQLSKTPAELFKFLETIDRKKEVLTAINSVVRGDPEGALRGNSGSAMALVQAQALQFNSGAQRSYYRLLSDVCTGLIKMFSKFANVERTIQISGKIHSQYLKEFKFSSENAKNISSVVFEMTNPIEKSIGGAATMAKDLLDKGMIKNPRQYVTTFRTGSLDAFTQDDEADEMGLISENERLRDGKEIKVIATQNHEEHIKSHMSVISDPIAYMNEELSEQTLSHIQEHVDTWQELSMSNPSLLIATGQNVLPPPPMPGMGAPMPPEGAAPQPGPDGKTPTDSSGIRTDMQPVENEAQGVRQPKMPINPATGERAPGPQGV